MTISQKRSSKLDKSDIRDDRGVYVVHRLSTNKRADTIYVMSRGKIVESGSHDELIEIADRDEGKVL